MLVIIRPDPRYMVLDAEGIDQIDSSGEGRLRALAARLRQSGVIMPIVRMQRQFTQVMHRTHLIDYVGRQPFSPACSRCRISPGGAGETATTARPVLCG